MFDPLFTISLIKLNRLMFTQLSQYDFLLPANEVWGKVMFSQVFFCPRGGGWSAIRRLGVCIQGRGVCIGGGHTQELEKRAVSIPLG